MIENLYVFRTDEKGEKRSGTSTTCIRYVIDTCIIIYSKTQALCNTNEQGKNHYLPLCFSNFVILYQFKLMLQFKHLRNWHYHKNFANTNINVLKKS